MLKRSFALSIVVLAVFASISMVDCKKSEPIFECTDTIGCVNIAPGKPIEIGVLQALSGGSGPNGLVQVRSIELAVAERGDQILGHPIELQIEDSRCSPEGGTNAAMKVVTHPQVLAVIGTYCSGAAKTAAKIISEAGLVMVSGTNSAPSLTAIDGEKGTNWQPGYFRTMFNGAEMARVVAKFAFRKLGVTKVATLNDGDIYTRGLTDTFGQVFAELGGEVVLNAGINKGDTDMAPLLTAVASSKAELLYFPIFQPEADFIVRKARQTDGLENIVLIGGGALLADRFIEALGEDGVGVYFPAPATPAGPANDALISAYKMRYGEPPQHFAYPHAYDATNLLLNAIEAVAVKNAKGTLHIGRQALRDALCATSGFEGVTGKLTCDGFGDCGAARFYVLRLTDPTAGIEGVKSNVVYTSMSDQKIR